MSDTIDIYRVDIIDTKTDSRWYTMVEADSHAAARKYAKSHRLLLGDMISGVEGPFTWDRRKWMRHGHYTCVRGSVAEISYQQSCSR